MATLRCRYTISCLWNRRPRQFCDFVKLSRERLDAFLYSEISHFALQSPQPLTLQRILQHRDVNSVAAFTSEQLPIRYSHRIKLLESLPPSRLITRIREEYVESFKAIRMVDHTDTEAFRKVCIELKWRHKDVQKRLVMATRAVALDNDLSTWEVDNFLDRFFSLRIGTEMLTSQYLAMSSSIPAADGVIDRDCCPISIIRTAADNAMDICRGHYGASPDIDIQCKTLSGESPRLPFIQKYLAYIMYELLKNSVRAVMERSAGEKVPRVLVTVSGDEKLIGIKISDEGGGIPLEDMSQVWSYLFTTATPLVGEHEHRRAKVPIAGFGCGLPLSRLYAKYLGGDVYLVVLPRFGTDVVLHLNALGDGTYDGNEKWTPWDHVGV